MSMIARSALFASALSLMIAGCNADPTTTRTESPPPAPPAAPDSVVRQLSIVIPPTGVSVGTVATLGFVARNAAGDTLRAATVVWYSSDPTIASVTKTGVVTGVHTGSVIMIADAGSVAVSATIAVGAAPVSGAPVARIDIGGVNSLLIGQGSTFTAVAVDAHGIVVPGVAVTWTSSNPQVVMISAGGNVQAVGQGNSTISATGGGVTSTRVLTVTGNAATSIVWDHSLDLLSGNWTYSADIAPGQRLQLTAWVMNSLAQAIPVQPKLIWRSSDGSVATVDSAGVVTGVSIGQAEIAVATAGVADPPTFTIHVQPASGVAGLRLINATGELASISFTSAFAPTTTLAFGESRETTVAAGMFRMEIEGLTANPIYPQQGNVNFTGPLRSNQHYTFISGGSGLYTPLFIPLVDDHPPIPASQAMVRLVMAGDYAANYFGNNIYFLPSGAPISAGGIVACYFDAPSISTWGTRLPGAFDLVLEDAGFYNASTQTAVPGVEAARFSVNPTPGRATTYIITGTTRATLRLITIEDP